MYAHVFSKTRGNSMIGPRASLALRLAFLAATLPLAACVSSPASSPEVDPTPAGHIEFYCASCVTGWVVYEIDGTREKRVLNLGMNRSADDLLHNPVRMRRANIKYPPGEMRFKIRLSRSLLSASTISERISVSVTENTILPVRIDARKQTERTLLWKPVVGPPLPVSSDPTSRAQLYTALSDPDWGVRWYAAEAISRIQGDVGDEIRTALAALASDGAYQRCLHNESTVQCSLVSEQATRVLNKLRVGRDHPLSRKPSGPEGS